METSLEKALTHAGLLCLKVGVLHAQLGDDRFLEKEPEFPQVMARAEKVDVQMDALKRAVWESEEASYEARISALLEILRALQANLDRYAHSAWEIEDYRLRAVIRAAIIAIIRLGRILQSS